MDKKFNTQNWAGNMFQKFEAVCQGVDEFICKDRVRYVESQMQTVGDSVKKLYSGLVQEFPPRFPEPLPHAMPLKQMDLVETCSSSRVGIKENTLDNNTNKPENATFVSTEEHHKPSSTGLCHSEQISCASSGNPIDEADSNSSIQQEGGDNKTNKTSDKAIQVHLNSSTSSQEDFVVGQSPCTDVSSSEHHKDSSEAIIPIGCIDENNYDDHSAKISCQSSENHLDNRSFEEEGILSNTSSKVDASVFEDADWGIENIFDIDLGIGEKFDGETSHCPSEDVNSSADTVLFPFVEEKSEKVPMEALVGDLGIGCCQEKETLLNSSVDEFESDLNTSSDLIKSITCNSSADTILLPFVEDKSEKVPMETLVGGSEIGCSQEKETLLNSSVDGFESDLDTSSEFIKSITCNSSADMILFPFVEEKSEEVPMETLVGGSGIGCSQQKETPLNSYVDGFESDLNTSSELIKSITCSSSADTTLFPFVEEKSEKVPMETSVGGTGIGCSQEKETPLNNFVDGFQSDLNTSSELIKSITCSSSADTILVPFVEVLSEKVPMETSVSGSGISCSQEKETPLNSSVDGFKSDLNTSSELIESITCNSSADTTLFPFVEEKSEKVPMETSVSGLGIGCSQEKETLLNSSVDGFESNLNTSSELIKSFTCYSPGDTMLFPFVEDESEKVPMETLVSGSGIGCSQEKETFPNSSVSQFESDLNTSSEPIRSIVCNENEEEKFYDIFAGGLSPVKLSDSSSELDQWNLAQFEASAPCAKIGSADGSTVNVKDLNMHAIDLSDKKPVAESRGITEDKSLFSFSYGSSRSKSYKKIIQDAFMLRKRLTKEYKQLAIWYGDIEKELGESMGENAASNMGTTPAQDPCDSEWEIL